jgi:hypothetical protein
MGTDTTSTDHRPRFERVTDDHHTAIQVDLTPIADKLLIDIANALHHRNRRAQMMQIGNPALPMATRLRIRNELVNILAAEGVFTHEVGDDQVEPMQAELEAVKDEPDWCDDCGERYATIRDLCGHCDEAASMRNALAGGRL